MNSRNRPWWKTGKFSACLPLVGILIAIVILSLFYKHGRDVISKGDDFTLNVHTEMLGVAISVLLTVFVIDTRNRRRDAERRQQDLIDRLLREVRSPEGIIARHAFHELKERHLMYGDNSILRGANLMGARPGGIDLSGTKLDGANLSESDFSNSYFVDAILDDTNFFWSCLKNAVFQSASLRNANLQAANLTKVHLICANLEGAELMDARLDSVQLYTRMTCEISREREDGTFVLEDTGQLILPDGSRATPTTDISRFTNKNHPEFWRSDDPDSPAYRGD